MAMELNFEPNKWYTCQQHDWHTCAQNANCYAYALNRSDYYWAVPGMGFAHTEAQHFFDSFNEQFKGVSLPDFQAQLKAGAVRDGLKPVEEPKNQEGYYLAALFFSDNPDDLDFHLYRKDSDGTWSHKDGWHEPGKVDANGNPINDPRNAANPEYPVFGGFFLVPNKGVALEQKFPLI